MSFCKIHFIVHYLVCLFKPLKKLKHFLVTIFHGFIASYIFYLLSYIQLFKKLLNILFFSLYTLRSGTLILKNIFAWMDEF